MAWEFYTYNNMIVKQLSLNSKKSQYERTKYIRIPIFHSIPSTTWCIIASLINEALPILFYKSHSYVRMRFIQYEHTFWLYSLEINEVWQKRKLRLTIVLIMAENIRPRYDFCDCILQVSIIFRFWVLRSICSNWLKRIFG